MVMSDSRKPIIAALKVMGLTMALIGGNAWRNHAEGGPDSQAKLDGAIASRRDKPIDPGSVHYFREMLRLLKREYVEPISDEKKLAIGAVRGMINSLGDSNCLFYGPPQYAVVQDSQKGKFHGIGVLLEIRLGNSSGGGAPAGDDDSDSVADVEVKNSKSPVLMVSAVAPGGPADRAGVKPGDVVSFVNSRWLPDDKTIDDFKKGKDAFDTHKISKEAYLAIHKAVREKSEHSILPIKALQELTSGDSGTMDVTWLRNGQPFETKIEKQAYSIAPFEARAGVISRLLFVPGASDSLLDYSKKHLDLKIDLRNNINGDLDEMRKCLAVLVPAGNYGYIVSNRDQAAKRAISISSGSSVKRHFTLITDRSTQGAAAVFANGIRARVGANVVGALSKNPAIVQYFALPDGSGYSLETGAYALKPRASVQTTAELVEAHP
jgi:carboxyl-terminal processing protease